jgi:2-polyprenyl-3-methyl-5-hydroxy-6-metoxy-1,4-benzoquinol methylase
MSEYKEYGYGDENDNHAHKYIYPKLSELIYQNKEDYILDLGCGNGSLAKKLINHGFQNIYGVDASVQGIKLAAKGINNRFFVQDISSKELPNTIKSFPFKIIISTEVIEHLYNPDEFIDFCKNILIKNGGGELILSTPYHGYLKNLVLSIFNKWDHHHTVLWQGGHIKFWSKKTLSNLLNNHGFKVTQFKGCGRVPFLWKSMIIMAKID